MVRTFLLCAVLLCVALLCALPSEAKPVTAVDLEGETALHAAARHPTWLKLLHFDRSGLLGAPRSAVDSAEFFFAAQGAFDPSAELIATVDAMREPRTDGLVHARCQFPARAMWLEQQGLLEPDLALNCSDWDAWFNEYGAGEIGLTFASGYLGNPASFFGHLLLHISPQNTSADQAATTNPNYTTANHLLDSSINFGADVPTSDGMLAYMLKGLVGGYQARYSQAPFYRNTSVYSETQMRDSWLYTLNLNDAERVFLIAHLYEILGHNFDYLFLSQNCASRIGRTLELVIDDEFTRGILPWVSPEQVIRTAAPHAQQPIHYPSRRRITEYDYHLLNAAQRQAAFDVWPSLNEFNLASSTLHALPVEQQVEVIDVLLSHALFIQQGDHAALGDTVQRELLTARLALPVRSAPVQPHVAPDAPHNALPSASVRVGVTLSDTLNEGVELKLRPLQYDLLESSDTRMPYAALEVLNLSLDSYDGDIRFKQALLFDVTNLNALQTGLPIQSTLAWQARAAIERTQLACRDCYVGQVQLSAGQSWQIHKLTSYLMGGAVLRTTGYHQGALAAAVQAGTLVDWSPEHRSQLTAIHHNAGQGSASRSWQLELVHRWQFDSRHDIRLQLVKDSSDTQISVNFARYL